jgi:S1-C subfamily serine protease
VDIEGRVLGINTSGLSRVMPVAVPVSTVNRVVQDLLEKGHVARGYLGLGMHPVRLPDGRNGVIVIDVQPDGPAGQAGVLIGDVLLTLDGTPIADTDDVHAKLGPGSAGHRLKAAIIRGGESTTIEIAVGERPKGER